jgi:hypothetical protein
MHKGEYTSIQDLWNGDTEGLFPSQLAPAEVTQSDLKVPDVVRITTFHGSLDFISCLFIFIFIFAIFLLILALSRGPYFSMQ